MKIHISSLRQIINNNFTFSDLSPRFEGVDSSTGNIFCPFHENTSTPAAKMYWDEVRGIWILHCFGECHRNYTAYDYVDLILCCKYQRYTSPLDFLKKNMNASLMYSQLEMYEALGEEYRESVYEQKTDYINNVYNECDGDIIEYIETLYTKE